MADSDDLVTAVPSRDDFSVAATFAAALAGRYTVARELGRGGMATVYLANDVRHDRQVAIKVLHSDLGSSIAGERFLHEIRTTAGLQHPHILPLLDSGEAAGRLFYVMPFVDGETLRVRLDRGRPLAVTEAIRIAVPLAMALDHAHRRGTVHRDLKPENILFADGLPVLADFGIALAIAQAGGERLTTAGVSLGTPAYMSPEQVTGAHVDGRSDQYALACVLFEMIAGHVPFRGTSVQGTMVAHVTAAIPPLLSPTDAVPATLAGAVRRAMAKEPGERFRSVAEFGEAVRTATSGTTSESPRAAVEADRSIVVLPFDNLSPDPDHAFFADGLHEEITADLSRIHALRVISRTSAMRLRGTTKDVPTIGRELNVRYILEGSVRRAGDSLRVTAQLIDAVTDAHVWAGKYGGTLDDVFGIQERLALEIVGALEITLTPRESRRIGTPRMKDPLAYECYLRARQLILGGTPESFASCRELLNRAREIVGENAVVLATEAYYRVCLVQCAVDADQRHYDAALELAARALRVDPECVEALVMAGLVHKFRGNLELSSRALRQALALEPNHADALTYMVFLCAEAGKVEQALDHARRMRVVNPFDSMSAIMSGVAEFFDGRFEDALSMFETAQRTDAANWFPSVWLVFCMEALSRDDDRRALGRRFMDVATTDVIRAFAHAASGSFEQAADVIGELTGPTLDAWRHDTEFSLFAAIAFANVGRREEAVDWLRSTIAVGLWNHPFLTRHHRRLSALSGYPPYDALMAELEPRWRNLVI